MIRLRRRCRCIHVSPKPLDDRRETDRPSNFAEYYCISPERHFAAEWFDSCTIGKELSDDPEKPSHVAMFSTRSFGGIV